MMNLSSPSDAVVATQRTRFGLSKTLLSVSTALMLLSSACGIGGGSDDPENAGNDGGGASQDNLVVAVPSLGTENWSPHQGSGGAERPVVYAVHERLIQTDFQTRQYSPGLVEEWEASDDLTEWTFTLRDDVRFHEGPDGQDYGMMTAEDVKFSYQLVLRDDSRLGRADAYRALVDDDINNFEIIDEHTFRLHLPEPNAIVPSLFSSTVNSLPVTSKAYWEEVGVDAASAHPIGTGPWKFESFESGASATLSAVADHWRKPPDFGNLEFRIIPEPDATLAQLRTGDVHFASLPLELLPEVEGEGELQVFSVPNVGVSSLYLGGHYPGSEFHDQDSPWIQADNPEQGRAVRQAMSLAIDREAIVNELLHGEGQPLIGPIHFVGGIDATDPAWVGDGAQVPAFDAERARELLAEGGYPDGFDVTMTSFEQIGLPFSTDISAAVASMLSDVGINVESRPIPEAEYDEMREARSTDGVIWQYIQQPLADEPGDRFSAFLPADAGAEFFFDGMAEYVNQLQSEPDYDERMAIARELGQDMIDYVGPAIGIAAVNTQWVAGPAVSDWEYIIGVPSVHNTEYISPSS